VLYLAKKFVQSLMDNRWIVLLICSCILFGTYYAYDIPAALNVPLEKYLATPNYQYYLQLFYSLYSIPNIILPFFGGLLIDKFGERRLLLFLSLCVTIGHLLFAFGVQFKWYMSMLIGRFIFGIGGESLAVLQSHITSRWFLHEELAFALGWNICVGRLGSVFNDLITPQICKYFGVVPATWFGLLMCLFSFGCAFLLSTFQGPQHTPTGSQKNRIFSQTTFPIGFWILNGIILTIYTTMVPFNTIHAAFLEYKFYPGDSIKSAQVMSVPDTVSALIVPFVGSFIDHYGHRSKTLIVSSFLLLIVHAIFFSIPVNSQMSPVPLLILLGTAYSLMTTTWSCIPLIVHTDFIATAFGISTCVCNLSLAIFPILIAHLTVIDRTYSLAEIFFVVCSLGGIGFSFGLLLWDQSANNVLERGHNPNQSLYLEVLDIDD
jgi:nitrate/nitrite transporter NarK